MKSNTRITELQGGFPTSEDNTPEREEHREVAVAVLKKLSALAVEDAVARAPRKEKDGAGRTRRIGHAVGKMVRQLLFWEGKGQLDDYWIYKSRREWWESEAALTRDQLRTATRVAEEEGLLETEPGYRPSDRRETTFYRLDMLAVARVVVCAEIENTERVLDRERRTRRRETLEEKLAELKADLATLERIIEGDYFEDEDYGDEDEEEEELFCPSGCECAECQEYERLHYDWCEDLLCEGCREQEPEGGWCPEEGCPAPTGEEAPEEVETFWLPEDLETGDDNRGNLHPQPAATPPPTGVSSTSYRGKLPPLEVELTPPTRDNSNASLETTSVEDPKESSDFQSGGAPPFGSAPPQHPRGREVGVAGGALPDFEARRVDDPLAREGGASQLDHAAVTVGQADEAAPDDPFLAACLERLHETGRWPWSDELTLRWLKECREEFPCADPVEVCRDLVAYYDDAPREKPSLKKLHAYFGAAHRRDQDHGPPDGERIPIRERY